MSKAIAVLGLGLALSAPAPGAPWQPHVGDAREYATPDGGRATLRVIRVRQEAERTVATVEQVSEQGARRTTRRVTWLRSPEGLALRLPGLDMLEVGPLVCYLSHAGLADTWTAQEGHYRDAAGEQVSFRLLARLEAREQVTVPAGTFSDCARVAYRLELEDEVAPRTNMWVWIKPELGIVKTRSLRGSVVQETQLVRYQDASPSGR